MRRRNKNVSVRMTEDEYAALTMRVEESGQTLQSFIINSVLGAKVSSREELSGLDSKKYQTILKFKSQLPDCPPEHILSENITAGNKQVDEYGELAVKHLTQTHREFNEDELQEIVSLYQAGKSTRKIGEMFGVCKTTIANMLRRQGVNVTRSKVQARLDADEVIAMYKNEITAEKIAKQFGVNPQTILNCLRSHGVKIRSRWDYKQE